MHDYLYFTEQHLAVRETVRALRAMRLRRLPLTMTRRLSFPWPTIKRMGELGFLGVPWPEELGVSGLDILSYVMVIHELAKVDASHGLTISAHTTLGTSPIVNLRDG
jgi:butyryl-CoA dehydrogenase